jgi:penicillin-binding protein 2
MFFIFKKKSFLNKDLEPHEILLDKLAKKKEEELGVSEKKLEIPILGNVGIKIFSLFILFFLVLFFRLFQLQIIEGENLKKSLQENKFIFKKIQAERGVIYDRNFNQLVFNRASFDLICQKNNLPNLIVERKKVIKKISEILKIDPEDLEKTIAENPDSTFVVKRNLDHQTLLVLETAIKEISGFQIMENSMREYLDDGTFSHLIGYLGKVKTEEIKEEPDFYSIFDYVGREGIEKYYEKILRKNPGQKRIERDVKGNIISEEIISFPEDGKSLLLYLDSNLQRKIKEELENKIKELGAEGGGAVALDPKTGGVLALVSLPSYDNNIFSSGNEEKIQKLLNDPKNPLFNRVIAGKYLTGSTIKPLIALAALEEKIISPNKKIDAQGKIVLQDPYNPQKTWEFKDWAVHGLTDMRKAIAQSVNVYFYTIGGGYQDQKGLGPTKIKEYLEKFGWGKMTRIDLPGEAQGFIPDKEWKKKVLKENWWDGDTYHLSIGQGFLQITPIEVAFSFLPIANGGKFFQPKIVKAILDSEKNIIEEFQPKIVKELDVDPENLKVVREGMRWAVTGQNSPLASAILLNSLPVSAAAKTGTAELKKGLYNNWIVVFAPYEEPEILLVLVVEKVKGLQAVTVPLAKSILEWYFTQKTK